MYIVTRDVDTFLDFKVPNLSSGSMSRNAAETAAGQGLRAGQGSRPGRADVTWSLFVCLAVKVDSHAPWGVARSQHWKKKMFAKIITHRTWYYFTTISALYTDYVTCISAARSRRRDIDLIHLKDSLDGSMTSSLLRFLFIYTLYVLERSFWGQYFFLLKAMYICWFIFSRMA